MQKDIRIKDSSENVGTVPVDTVRFAYYKKYIKHILC